MNLQKLFENFVLKVRLLGRVRGTKLSNKHHFNQLKEHGVKIRKLNSAQKKKVDAIFKNKYKCKYTYATHELYYSVTGKFNPAIIPEDLFRIQIEHQLNDSNSKNVLADKSYFDRFLPTANFPSTIIRNIEGLFFDKNYKLISKEDIKPVFL